MKAWSISAGICVGILVAILVMTHRGLIAFAVFTAAVVLAALTGQNQDPPTTVGSTTTNQEE